MTERWGNGVLDAFCGEAGRSPQQTEPDWSEADEPAVLASRLGRLLDAAVPGWRDSPEGRWLNAVERS